jgi:hypothetical protein
VRLTGRASSWLLALSLSGAWTTTARAATRYVFTTFLGDGAAQEKLSVYTSTDGLNFELLSNTGYGGPTGVLRDPSILKHSDGKYYLAYTLQSWTTSSMSFGIATSTNLEDWTFLVEVPAGVTSAHDTWAPEWFTDTDGVHLIVNIDTLGTDSDFRSYDFKAKDDSLKTWDAPVELGIGPNNIDTFVVKSGATYHAFSKNESTKYIEHATSSSFHGPWNWIGKANWAGWGSGKEGIALFQLDDGTWRMFLDCYGGCGFLYADSSDLTTWSSTKTVPGGLSGVVRHGTVLREVTGAAGSSAASAGGFGGNGRSGGGGMPGIAGRSSAGAANGGAASGGAASGGAASGGAGGAVGEGGGGGRSGNGGRAGSASVAGGMTAGGPALSTGGGPASGGGWNGGRSNAGAGAMLTLEGDSVELPVEDGCGCAVPTTEARAPWLAGFGFVLLAFRRRRSLSR